MNDLDVLKRLPGRVVPPDRVTRDRVRAMVKARTAPGRGSPGGPRGPRATRAGALAVAAALAVGAVAAAVGVHHWTAHRPVAIPAGGRLPDPNGRVSSPALLASTVAEFAPAIRLPTWGSFDEWRRHIDAVPVSNTTWWSLDRASVASDMVWVAQCQWTQEWLKATARGDRAGATRAAVVLGGIGRWDRVVVAGDAGSFRELLGRMRTGDRGWIQLQEDACAYSGSWGTTAAQQNAKAKGDLTAAAPAAQGFLRRGGTASAFTPAVAGKLASNVNWTWPREQPAPARPGTIFIAEPAGPGVTLVAVSESGTQFCAVVTGTAVVRGTTGDRLPVTGLGQTIAQAAPGPVTCVPGGW